MIAGIALLAILVISRSHSSTSTSTTTATPEASASSTMSATPETTEATPTASAAAPSAADGTHTAPLGIVAHYTATGATIFWNATTDATNFNVEVASNGGAWKLISTVPATQLSLDITKGATDGWSSFRVSAVYADGTVVAGKVFGLPGQYA